MKSTVQILQEERNALLREVARLRTGSWVLLGLLAAMSLKYWGVLK